MPYRLKNSGMASLSYIRFSVCLILQEEVQYNKKYVLQKSCKNRAVARMNVQTE